MNFGVVPLIHNCYSWTLVKFHVYWNWYSSAASMFPILLHNRHSSTSHDIIPSNSSIDTPNIIPGSVDFPFHTLQSIDFIRLIRLIDSLHILVFIYIIHGIDSIYIYPKFVLNYIWITILSSHIFNPSNSDSNHAHTPHTYAYTETHNFESMSWG